MIDVELQTSSGMFVAIVDVLGIHAAPTVVQWGARTFVRYTESGNVIGTPVYREVLVAFSLTPAPGRARNEWAVKAMP